tara:strand:- start:149 stop:283 length:135 start_codon:yes stop_codon:yes gene_type:complete
MGFIWLGFVQSWRNNKFQYVHRFRRFNIDKFFIRRLVLGRYASA